MKTGDAFRITRPMIREHLAEVNKILDQRLGAELFALKNGDFTLRAPTGQTREFAIGVLVEAGLQCRRRWYTKREAVARLR